MNTFAVVGMDNHLTFFGSNKGCIVNYILIIYCFKDVSNYNLENLQNAL